MFVRFGLLGFCFILGFFFVCFFFLELDPTQLFLKCRSKKMTLNRGVYMTLEDKEARNMSLYFCIYLR